MRSVCHCILYRSYNKTCVLSFIPHIQYMVLFTFAIFLTFCIIFSSFFFFIRCILGKITHHQRYFMPSLFVYASVFSQISFSDNLLCLLLNSKTSRDVLEASQSGQKVIRSCHCCCCPSTRANGTCLLPLRVSAGIGVCVCMSVCG